MEYVQHRLRVASELSESGSSDPAVEFTGGAFEAMHLASGGVPRLINLVCDRSLQRACDARRKTIDRDLVNAAVRDLGLGERPVNADAGMADMLPLPFEPPLEATAPPAVSVRTTMSATPPPEPKPDPAGGMSAFEPEAPAAPATDTANPLSEFDSEPESTTTGPVERTASTAAAASAPAARGLVWTLARAFGFATAALVVAAGAGVLDTRVALSVVSPDVAPAPPAAPDGASRYAETSLTVADALTAALTDARAHEPDAFTASAGTFRDRRAADALVAELAAQGFRARWAEIRVDDDVAQQQIFVDGYGTLEEALTLVSRLRHRPSTMDAALFRQPGAIRRQDLP
jgi:hypothetical protein